MSNWPYELSEKDDAAKRARYSELVAIRKEVEAGRRQFAHDGEILLLMEEQRLAAELGIE